MIICTHTFTDTCNVCTHTEWGKPRPWVHVESQPDHDWLCEWQGEDRVSGSDNLKENVPESSDNLKENVPESSDNLKENVLESSYTLCTRMWCAESLVSFPHHLLSPEVTLEWDCYCPFTCMLSLVPRLSRNANMYRVESLVSFVRKHDVIKIGQEQNGNVLPIVNQLHFNARCVWYLTLNS